MMSQAVIQDMQSEAASQASKRNLTPYVAWPQDIGEIQTLRRIPNFGDYRPEGWEMIDKYFVDSSGLGQPYEPAMTVQAFSQALKVNMGYAIISEGQFQVYVGEFKKQ